MPHFDATMERKGRKVQARKLNKDRGTEQVERTGKRARRAALKKEGKNKGGEEESRRRGVQA